MAISWDRYELYVRQRINNKLWSDVFGVTPLLAFLVGRSAQGDRQNAFGVNRPDYYRLFGGETIGPAERQRVRGSTNHMWKYHTAAPSDGKYITDESTTQIKSTSEWDEDNEAFAELRWARFADQMRIRNRSLRESRGAAAIGEVLENSIDKVWQQHTDKLYRDMWSGNPSNQDNRTWDSILGIQEWFKDANICARVDRSPNTNAAKAFRPKRITAQKAVSLRLIREANIDQEIARYGPGIDLVICNPNEYMPLADEAEAQGGQKVTGEEVEEMRRGGFRFEGIKWGNATIAYDYQCPQGEIYMFTLDSWFLEFQDGANFTWTPSRLVDEFTNNPDGGDYSWQKLVTQLRFGTRLPGRNLVYTNVVV